MIDTHAHLNLGEFDQIYKETIEDAAVFGINKFICCGTSLKTSKKAVQISNECSNVFCAIGIHPEAANEYHSLKEIDELSRMATDPKVVAIGEIGLDWWWNEKSFSEYPDPVKEREKDKELQRDLFRAQLKLAKEKGLPVIIHDRDAHDEVLEEVQNSKLDRGGVLHCFSGDLTFANKFIDLGFYISFAGNITYKKNEHLREVAKSIPVERILCETDCPYLAPEPMRGTFPNTPANVRFVYECISAIRGIEMKKLEREVDANVYRLFGV